MPPALKAMLARNIERARHDSLLLYMVILQVQRHTTVLYEACETLVTVQVYEEGTHLMIPWFEWPYIYDVRARPNVIQSTSGSKDLQMVRSMSLAQRKVPALPSQLVALAP